jgi:hypothetical protein
VSVSQTQTRMRVRRTLVAKRALDLMGKRGGHVVASSVCARDPHLQLPHLGQ